MKQSFWYNREYITLNIISMKCEHGKKCLKQICVQPFSWWSCAKNDVKTACSRKWEHLWYTITQSLFYSGCVFFRSMLLLYIFLNVCERYNSTFYDPQKYNFARMKQKKKKKKNNTRIMKETTTNRCAIFRFESVFFRVLRILVYKLIPNNRSQKNRLIWYYDCV